MDSLNRAQAARWVGDDTQRSGVGGVGGVGLAQLISGRLLDHAVTACSGESARNLDVGQLSAVGLIAEAGAAGALVST